MASTSEKRLWWADWRCNPTKMDAVSFPGPDRDWHLPVADAAVPAFELFADLMRKHDYDFREVSGGTYNCRKMAGTDSWSLHAYGIAIDLNPSKNPYGTHTHNFPQGFIDDVLATGLFRWGMDFDDPMHWEIDVPPSGIRLPEENPVSLPINADSGKEEKRHVQEMLGVPATGDWDFKPAVKDLAVRAHTGDPKGKDGTHINGRMYTQLLEEFIARKAPQGAPSAHDHDGRYVKNVSVSK